MKNKSELYIVDSRDLLAPPHIQPNPRRPYVLCRNHWTPSGDVLTAVDRYPSRAEAITARLVVLGIVGAIMLSAPAADAATVSINYEQLSNTDISDLEGWSQELSNTLGPQGLPIAAQQHRHHGKRRRQQPHDASLLRHPRGVRC